MKKTRQFLFYSLTLLIIAGGLVFFIADNMQWVKDIAVLEEIRGTLLGNGKAPYQEILAKERVKRLFTIAGIPYPPQKATFIGIKDKNNLELWAPDAKNKWKLVHTYPVLGASGTSGPKLKQGDLQVPEGVYRIEYLNPKSKYHLSMKINYPNPFDKTMALKDKRTDLGGDIFIHGSNVSIGCLAMGNPAIEELYKLVQDTGPKNINVILAPTDMRTQKPDLSNLNHITWISELYNDISTAMMPYQKQ